jgi:anti-sigma-K factor RskA
MSGDIHALAGAYALDAVDDVERAAFDRHLADCDSCRLEVAELRETAARLAGDTADVPPAALRQRVLAEVARTPQQRSGASGAAATAGERRWRRWTAAAVAAGVLAVGASATTWSVTDARLREERAASARARQVADVLTAADARVRTGALAGGGTATVVVSPGRDRGVVLLRDLPDPGSERAYQLWLVRGAEPPRSVGLLAAGATATTMLVGPVAGAGTFGVSNEPAAGSASPTRVVTLMPLG